MGVIVNWNVIGLSLENCAGWKPRGWSAFSSELDSILKTLTVARGSVDLAGKILIEVKPDEVSFLYDPAQPVAELRKFV